jgi:hypothetical protein
MAAYKSIYKRSAEYGVPFGAYLSVLTISGIYSDKLSVLTILSLAMLIAIPFIVYRYQRRTFLQEGGTTEFAALWMMGILTFIYGSLLCCLVSYFVLQYLRPGYLYEQAQIAINTYKAIPGMQNSDIVRVLQQAIKNNMLPTAIQFLFNLFWVGTFCGSVLSALLAFIAEKIPLPKDLDERNSRGN